jgi:type IV secretion system protein VirB4
MLNSILNKQLAVEEFAPQYGYHVTDSIVSIGDGRVMFVVKCRGVPYETVNSRELEGQYDALNGVMLSLGKRTGSRLGAWVYWDHYETTFEADYHFHYKWLSDFHKRYMKRFKGRAMFDNDFYIAFTLKPFRNDSLDETIREMEEVQSMVLQGLRRYECEPLTSYEHNGHLFSQAYEFLAYLSDGVWQRVPVTAQPAYKAIGTSSLYQGYKLLETRFAAGGRRFSALYDLKDFPEPTRRGLTNPLLRLEFPFLLCFSFTFLLSTEAVSLINQALNKMRSAGDEAEQQQSDMEEAKGSIMAGEVIFGELHGALMVHGASEKQAEDRGTQAMTAMAGECGAIWVPALLSAPSTLLSMFPGNAKHRPRPMPKTTRNLCGVFSMNTYSVGKAKGNPIGDGSALLPVENMARGAYSFNFHYSRPEVDERGTKLAGHSLLLGSTGTGKTTAQTTKISMFDRWGFNLFGIDKDGSMRGFVVAHEGTYFELRNGEPTGLNPFQIPDSEFNRAFLYDLVAACGADGERRLKAADNRRVKEAVDAVFELPWEHRRFSTLLQSVPEPMDGGEDGLRRRLEQWCYDDGRGNAGRFAYALDNPVNKFDWEKFSKIAFDVTDFLVEGHPATEPILSYLLHLKTLMQRFRPGLLVTVCEEFWLPAKYPTTAKQLEEILRVGRRRDEFLLLVSQMPTDASKSPLMSVILEQTATKLYFPNDQAEYRTEDGHGYHRFMTEKEFKEFRKLEKYSRKYMIKQGSQSCIAKIDLSGLEDYIAVLAMAKEDFPFLEKAQAQAGKHPDAWIPVYLELRRKHKAAKVLSTPEKEATV